MSKDMTNAQESSVRFAIRIKIAIWIINQGVKILPKGYNSRVFIENCISTKIIKVAKK